ncbi:MAG: lytic transglycosylase domain-containing protein, partial [Rhodospirillales bacterium]
LRRWQKTVKANGDPLLFIEAIPSRETRIFVERVLANYWIYREQLGKHLLTRNDVILNEWPRYQAWR